MPDTATDLGTSTSALAKMSRFKQLDFVYKYLSQSKFQGKVFNLGDLYLSVLSGGPGMGQNNSFTVFSSPSSAYTGNSCLDANNDGIINRGEAIGPVLRIYNKLTNK